MGFWSKLWGKRDSPSPITPPGYENSSADKSMPFVRDQQGSENQTHPRLQRMAEIMKNLPPPPPAPAPKVEQQTHHSPNHSSQLNNHQMTQEHVQSAQQQPVHQEQPPRYEMPVSNNSTFQTETRQNIYVQQSVAQPIENKPFENIPALEVPSLSPAATNAPVIERRPPLPVREHHQPPKHHADLVDYLASQRRKQDENDGVNKEHPIAAAVRKHPFHEKNHEEREVSHDVKEMARENVSSFNMAPQVQEHSIERATTHALVQPNTVTHEVMETREEVKTSSFEPDFNERASNAFYASNGAAFWTLAELGDALINMDDGVFNHHVNNERNDFASWIEGCFTGDTKAVASMLHGLDKQAIVRLFVNLRSPRMVNAAPRYDDKAPVATDWMPSVPVTGSLARNPKTSEVLDRLKAAHLQSTVDIGAARESFIGIRNHVWTELSDEERREVLPHLREVYEHLRTS